MKFLNSLDILGSGGTLFDVQGSQGQLFSVTDSLSGSIFAVSDISGVPILDVNSSGTSYFSGNVGIGTAAPGAPLQVNRSSNGINQYIYNTTSGQAYIAFGNATTGLFSQDFTSANGLLVGIDQDETAIIWNAEATRLRFGTSGTERMSIAAAGNVGIGTTSPDQKLHIIGTSSDTAGSGLFAVEGGGGNVSWVFRSTATGDNLAIDREYGGAGSYYNTLTLQRSTGNVGIGTTTPGYKLSVNGDIHIPQNEYIYFDNSAHYIRRGASSVELQGYNGLDLRTAGSSRVFITQAGNVGIGTTSPDYKLDVENLSGESWIRANSATSSDVGYRFARNGVNKWVIYNQGSSDDFEIYQNSATASRLRIKSNGNVGIGTTNPSSNLEIKGASGSLYDTQLKIVASEETGAADTGGSFSFIGHDGNTARTHGAVRGLKENSTVGDYGGYLSFDTRANNAAISEKMRITGSGNVGIGTTSPSQKLEVNGNIKIGDAQKSLYGAGNDLQIYHDGSHSYINDAGTGALKILASQLEINNAANSENIATFTQDGAVSLFYNNAKKFETTSTGATVSGALAVDGKITNLTAGTGNLDAVNVQQLNNATTGTLVYKGTWSAAPTTTSVLDGAVSGGTIVIDAANPGISVGATITGTGISGTVTVSNIAADGITIAISSSQTIADGTTLTFTTVGGTPDLSQSSRKVTGHYYICETAGAATPNGASTTPNEWAVGDWATFSDLTTDAWQKIDNSSVLSGAGTGGKVPVWSGSGTSVTLADAPITVSGNNSTFAGNGTFGGDVTVNGGQLFLPDGGDVAWAGGYSSGKPVIAGNSTVINMYPAGNVSGAQFSLSSTTATFAGDVNAGSYTKAAQTTVSILSDAQQNSILKFREDDDLHGFTLGYYGVPNDFVITRHDGSSTGVAVMSIPRDSSNVTFTGDVTATANYTAGNSKIIYKAQRNGGAVAGDWSYDDATTDMSLGTSTAHSFSLKTGDTRALTLDASQNATFAGTVATGNMTISGQEIDVSSGDLTLDVAGDIVLNADGGDIQLADAGAFAGRLGLENGDLNIASTQQDYDIRLKGNDGGSIITALHLDMSAAGAATFSGEVTSTDDINALTKIVVGENATAEVRIKKTNTGSGKLSFYNNDGTSSTQQGYLSLDANEDFVMYSAANNENHFYAGGVLNSTQIGANTTFAGNVTATNILTVAGAATGSPYLQFTQGGSQKAYIQYADSGDSFELQSDNQFAVRTGGSTAALIINSSQNATFAGTINANLGVVASGAISSFETTLTNNEDWENSPISILERGNVQATQTADKYSPNLNFHWGGVVSKSLWMGNNGHLNWGEYSATGIPAADGRINAAFFGGELLGTINTATTGVTQTAGNNSTLIATTAYADAAAAAGGGNFLPLAGGTMTGNVIFNDSKELRLGTSSDFKGFHNGTNTHLSNYTGQLVIENYSDDKDILFASDDGSGGVTTYMYLDGSITETRFKKPSRHDDSVIAKFGDGNDLNIFHNGSNSYIETTNSSTGDFYVTARGTNHDLYLEAADDIYIRPQGNENGIKVLGNDSVELYFNNVRKIRTTTEGVIVEGDIKVDSVLLSNQENTDVDTGTETVASVPIATYTAAFFDFVIKNGTNLRAGTVFACHDGTNVVYTETSTNDLGDTSDVTLSVDISGTDMRLRATVTSNDWSVKSLIRAI